MVGPRACQVHEMRNQLAPFKTLLKFAERVEHSAKAPQVPSNWINGECCLI
jgi:hypothetical protein